MNSLHPATQALRDAWARLLRAHRGPKWSRRFRIDWAVYRAALARARWLRVGTPDKWRVVALGVEQVITDPLNLGERIMLAAVASKSLKPDTVLGILLTMPRNQLLNPGLRCSALGTYHSDSQPKEEAHAIVH